MNAYSAAQHRTWSHLFDLLAPRVAAHACDAHRRGLAMLDLPHDRIPTLDEVNERLEPASGWLLVDDDAAHRSAADYYAQVSRRRFPVSLMLRAESTLEYAPEPDVFHDLFGHAPLLTDPRVSELEVLIAATFLRVGEADRERVKQLAWYSTEFGLVREEGEVRLLGAGLLSSAAEIDRVASAEVLVRDFACDGVLNQPRTVWEINPALFVADGVAGYRDHLQECFAKMPNRTGAR